MTWYVLKLYVTGNTSRSQRAVANLRRICEDDLPGQAGVFVSFEAPADDIRRNMRGVGWDIARWEAEGKWLFVDASPQVDTESIITDSIILLRYAEMYGEMHRGMTVLKMRGSMHDK